MLFINYPAAFKCNIYTVSDGAGLQNKFAMIHYYFEGPEVQVKVKPHGNSKTSEPYFRTSETTKEVMKDAALTKPPKL